MRINQVKKLQDLGKTVTYSQGPREPVHEAEILDVDTEGNLVQIKWYPNEYIQWGWVNITDEKSVNNDPVTTWVLPDTLKSAWEADVKTSEWAKKERAKSKAQMKAGIERYRREVKYQKDRQKVAENLGELKDKLANALGVELNYLTAGLRVEGENHFNFSFSETEMTALLKKLNLKHTLAYLDGEKLKTKKLA